MQEPNITPGPAHQWYLALVFKTTDGPLAEDIRYWLRQWHGRHLQVDIVNISALINGTIDADTLHTVIDRIKSSNYSYCYITSDSPYDRRIIRAILREQSGINVHIQRYSKFVHGVRVHQMWKYRNS